MALPKFERRITIPTGGWTITFTDSDGVHSSKTVPAGDYYLTSTTSLLSALVTTLNDGGGITYTVTLDDNSDSSLGKVTITPSAGTIAITWVSTDLRDILGFTGNVAATSSAVSTNASPALWLPNSSRTPTTPDPASTSYEMGWAESDYMVVVAPSGASVRSVYNTRYVEEFRFDNVRGSKAWKALESTVNESYQTFHQAVMDNGGVPFRYHPDRSSDAVFWTMVLAESAGTMRPTPTVAGWVGASSLWAVQFASHKLV